MVAKRRNPIEDIINAITAVPTRINWEFRDKPFIKSEDRDLMRNISRLLTKNTVPHYTSLELNEFDFLVRFAPSFSELANQRLVKPLLTQEVYVNSFGSRTSKSLHLAPFCFEGCLWDKPFLDKGSAEGEPELSIAFDNEKLRRFFSAARDILGLNIGDNLVTGLDSASSPVMERLVNSALDHAVALEYTSCFGYGYNPFQSNGTFESVNSKGLLSKGVATKRLFTCADGSKYYCIYQYTPTNTTLSFYQEKQEFKSPYKDEVLFVQFNTQGEIFLHYFEKEGNQPYKEGASLQFRVKNYSDLTHQVNAKFLGSYLGFIAKFADYNNPAESGPLQFVQARMNKK